MYKKDKQISDIDHIMRETETSIDMYQFKFNILQFFFIVFLGGGVICSLFFSCLTNGFKHCITNLLTRFVFYKLENNFGSLLIYYVYKKEIISERKQVLSANSLIF